MLYLDGFDLRGADLIDRKGVLEALLDNSRGLQLVRCAEHLDGDGALILEHLCKHGLEGTVSKRADAPYRSGKRIGSGEARLSIGRLREPHRASVH